MLCETPLKFTMPYTYVFIQQQICHPWFLQTPFYLELFFSTNHLPQVLCFSAGYLLKHAQHCNFTPTGIPPQKQVPNFFFGSELRELICECGCLGSSPKLSSLLLFAEVGLCKLLVCGWSCWVKKNSLRERFPIILTSGQVRYAIRSDPWQVFGSSDVRPLLIRVYADGNDLFFVSHYTNLIVNKIFVSFQQTLQ